MKPVRILLPIDHRGTTEGCKQAAASLALRFGLQVEVLHACAAPWLRPPYATELSPFYSDELIGLAREQVGQEQEDARAWFETWSRGYEGPKLGFGCVEGFVASTVAANARMADLTLAPTIGAAEDVFWDGAREGALLQSGRPMLAIPEGSGALIGESIVIAWKDGPEAVRAIAAASPFLDTAKSILLVAVEENGGADCSLAEMAGYLTLRSHKVKTKLLPGANDAGEQLLLEAAGHDGALLVMGAYGHWRWREWAFGGVTEHVLRNTTVPVLMMH